MSTAGTIVAFTVAGLGTIALLAIYIESRRRAERRRLREMQQRIAEWQRIRAQRRLADLRIGAAWLTNAHLFDDRRSS